MDIVVAATQVVGVEAYNADKMPFGTLRQVRLVEEFHRADSCLSPGRDLLVDLRWREHWSEEKATAASVRRQGPRYDARSTTNA